MEKKLQTETIKVLILEDSATDSELIKDELENSNYRADVRVVDDELGFRSTLENFKPDLILSDYHVPKFSGLEALIISQRDVPETPFVFVTGTVGEEIAAETILSGASGLILKNNLGRLPQVINGLFSGKFIGNPRISRTIQRIETRIKKNVEALNRLQAFLDQTTDPELKRSIKLTIGELKQIQDDLKTEND